MEEKITKTILVMEDNAAIVDALELLLEAEGYRVTTWKGGAAIPHLQAPFPDLILLDLLLSGSDGSMICRQLKAEANTQAIPIIVLSANTHTPQIARDAGADAWIKKPFDVTTLLALVETAVGRSVH